MKLSARVLETLSYLPAFELAARHLSFKRAAAELHRTPSAVSQQMRSLEAVLDAKLFRRLPRGLALTSTGEEFAALVSDTLERYRRGAEQLLKQPGGHVLRVTTDAFVAHEVLIPALDTFRHGKRRTDLRIETSSTPVDLDEDAVDAAIRYGEGPWRGLVGTVLCEVVATAVCAPGLIRRDRITTPRAFARYPLIRMRDQPDPWDRFAKFFSIELPKERLVFDTYFASIRAAEKGLGIAVGLFPTTSSAVLEGRLITPFSVRVRPRAKFHFLCRPRDAERQVFVALRVWAQARFADLPALPAAPGVMVVDEP